jgi:Cd2+/Zn2+-exporting ATPase
MSVVNTSIPTPFRLRISGMDCSECAMTIEDAIRKLDGVETAQVNFTTEVLEGTGSADAEKIAARVRQLGYKVSDGNSASGMAAPTHHVRGLRGFINFLVSQNRTRTALIVTMILFVMIALRLSSVITDTILSWAFIAATVISGAPFVIKGLRSMFLAHRITIDILVGLAAIGAVVIGESGEAATVVLLFTLGEALEAYSAERARDSLRSLFSLQPQEAIVLREHIGGHDEPAKNSHDLEQKHEQKHEHGAACSGDHHHEPEIKTAVHAAHDHQHMTNVADVVIGDRVLVRPGQRVPLDGVIIKGESALDQSPVTGESMPVAKKIGDEVLAGSVNSDAALEIRVSRVSGDSTIARIARLVEQAQSQRSPAEKFIDKFARWYTPLVVLVAAMIAFLPPLLFAAPLWETAAGHGWLYRGLALLIVACPCALVIAIPVTVVSSLTRLAQLGVLVKGGEQLDALADISAVAFDKTGTLTQGRPVVTALSGVDCAHSDAVVTDCDDCDDVIALAAAIEKQSEHPIAHAIISAADDRRVAARYGVVEQVKAVAGRGIVGVINAQKIAVGSVALINEQMSPTTNYFKTENKTLVYVGRDDLLVGMIGVEDAVRSDSAKALRDLHAVDVNIKTIMLTGDRRDVAEKIAQQLGGIDEVHAQLLPEDKLAQIARLQQRYGHVAMIGDGINDAPALAQADVGIAMGAGTAQAMETADVVLMQDDLLQVATALRFARLTRRRIKQNIALSLGLKVAFLALAIPGFATLWMAVLADVGATLLVTLNGMRMVREN